MNERIKELAKQARQIGEYVNYGQIRLSPEQFEQKFAELIVKECIAQARSEEDRFYGLGEDDLALTMEHFQEVLKHHFGVEE